MGWRGGRPLEPRRCAPSRAEDWLRCEREWAKRVDEGARRAEPAPDVHALLAVLESAEVRRCLARAAAAFEAGDDDTDALEVFVRDALRARAGLDGLLAGGGERAGWGRLRARLRALDAALDAHRSAVMLLAPSEYVAALGGAEPPESAWWGERKRVAARLRERELDELLACTFDPARLPSRV